MFVEMPLRHPEKELQGGAGVIMPLHDFGHMVGLQLRADTDELGILLPVDDAQKAQNFGHQAGGRARFRGGAEVGPRIERGTKALQVNQRWVIGFERV